MDAEHSKVSSASCDTDISGSLCNSAAIQSSVAVAAVTQSKHIQFSKTSAEFHSPGGCGVSVRECTWLMDFRVSRGNKFNIEGKTASVMD